MLLYSRLFIEVVYIFISQIDSAEHIYREITKK
jgi:hypothetical protein